MQSQKAKIGLAVIITAIVVGGASYYFWGNKNTKTTPPQNITFTKSSKEYAAMGQELTSAFMCSAWASKIGDTKEAERLFLFGYEQGKTFLGAGNAGKIESKDIDEEVPILVTMLLGGPSEEFILGRIYSAAEEEALDAVFYTNYDRNNLNPEDLQKSIAGNKFRDGNCQLIGK